MICATDHTMTVNIDGLYNVVPITRVCWGAPHRNLNHEEMVIRKTFLKKTHRKMWY